MSCLTYTVISHFIDESSQAIDCSGTNNQRTTKEYTKTNKLAIVKKKNTHTQKETKAKPAGPSSPVRTAHMSVHILWWYNCGTQYSTEQIPLIFQTIIIARITVYCRGGAFVWCNLYVCAPHISPSLNINKITTIHLKTYHLL